MAEELFLKIKIEPLPGSEIDGKELERLTRQMRKELKNLDGVTVSSENKGVKLPQGAKGLPIAEIMGEIPLHIASIVMAESILHVMTPFARKGCRILFETLNNVHVLEPRIASDDVLNQTFSEYLEIT